MLDQWALRHSAWKKRLVRWAYEDAHMRDAACLRALCQSEAGSIRAYGLENPIAIIPNGVELPEDRGQGTGGRGQGTGRKALLFLGRIHPKKGLANALRAWAEVTRHGAGGRGQEEWAFAIAGWDQGGHEAELKRVCVELGLGYAAIPAAEFVGESVAEDSSSSLLGASGRAAAGTPYRPTETPASVVFVGPAFGEAKDRLLRSADAFILPSFSEGLPMAVLEAWAYGLPVLMTDQCNLPEGFAAGAAIRVRQETGDRRQGTGDREVGMSIADGMRELVGMSDSDRVTMGMRGRRLVEDQFTWPKVAAQMLEVYEWVVSGGPRPRCVEFSTK